MRQCPETVSRVQGTVRQVRTWDVEGWLFGDPRQGSVVMWTPDLQRLALEDDAVKRHGLGGLIHGPELDNKGLKEESKHMSV